MKALLNESKNIIIIIRTPKMNIDSTKSEQYFHLVIGQSVNWIQFHFALLICIYPHKSALINSSLVTINTPRIKSIASNKHPLLTMLSKTHIHQSVDVISILILNLFNIFILNAFKIFFFNLNQFYFFLSIQWKIIFLFILLRENSRV